jgi:hypothetical protein
MTPRRLAILASVTCVALLGTLVLVLWLVPSPPTRDRSVTNPMVGRPDMVDRLVMFDSDREFLTGHLDHVAVVHDTPAQIVLLDRRPNTYPRYGYWTSPVIECEFGVTELIPSWNVTTPRDTGVRFQIRTRERFSGAWSPWLYIGQWGRTMIASSKDEPVAEFDHGMVYTDNLLLERPASAFQVRASLQSFDLDRKINPMIRRIAVSYSGQARDAHQHRTFSQGQRVQDDWARDLPVPFRAQGDAPRNISGSICSPTSTSMVMAFCGVDRPTVENALAIYDEQADLFGNWGRAVARAGECGLDAWITRVRNWDQVKSFIAQGQPLIAAIRFKRGEFPSNVMRSTAGHLLVIRGFKPNGDVICNDPASRDKGNGVVYKADELARAWFTNAGGVAYVIRRGGAPLDKQTWSLK